MKKHLSFTFTLLLSVLFLQAQIGIIDPDFKPGTGFGPDKWTGKCETIVQQPDGKLLIGGQFTEYNGKPALYIARLNPDGSLDESFQSQFEKTWGYQVRTIALQADGKMWIGGEFSRINGKSRNRITRLNSDGSLDTTFNPKSGLSGAVDRIALQKDGKALVSGGFITYDHEWGGSQTPVHSLIRLNGDGSLDTTFDAGKAFPDVGNLNKVGANAIVVQPDGRIIAAGTYSTRGSGARNYIRRYLSDGSRDTTFDAGDHRGNVTDNFNGMVNDLVLLPNGQLMVSGNYVGVYSGIDRLNANGSPDTTFRITPEIRDHRSYPIAVQPDGKILSAAVNFGAPNEAFVVERYLTNGQLDTSFPKRILNEEVTDILVQKDGNIVLVGYFDYNPTGIMRLLGDSPEPVNSVKSLEKQFKVYPNPAREFVTISDLPAGWNMRISDISGKAVYSLASPDETSVKIPVHSFPSGWYTIQIESPTGTAFSKLVVRP